MAFGIESALGLYALISLLPFILLYLVRPKAKELIIPSLLFFLKSDGTTTFNSFFRHFLRDILFLMQLIIILMLALSFAQPYFEVEKDLTSTNVVIIIDASASSQVKENGKTRFDNGIQAAKKMLGQKNTIIVAKEVPLVLAQDASSSRASRILSDIDTTEAGTRVGDAMLLAAELLKDGKGLVAVVSDFINTEGQEPEIAKGLLESKGYQVKFINTAEKKGRNVGIVELDLGREESKIKIKNFNDNKEEFTLDIAGKKQSLVLEGKSAEIIRFSTPAGKATIKIDVKDDFSVDNQLEIIGPEKTKVKVLLITNNASPFIKNALTATGEVEVEISSPPIVNVKGYDIIILHDIAEEKLLTGTLEDIEKEVKSGTHLIIHAQNDSNTFDYKGLLPVTIKGHATNGVVRVNQITRFTKNVDFGVAGKYFIADTTHSVVAEANSSPIITIGSLGAGKIIYFGLIEDSSDFKFSPEYPIFWYELVNTLIERKDLESLNYATGKSIVLTEEQEVQTPKGKIKDSNIVLEYEGEYKLPDRTIVANLLNEPESEINNKIVVGQKSSDFKITPLKEKRKLPLGTWMLITALILLMLEFTYIKMRGDI